MTIRGDDPNEFVYNITCVQGETLNRIFTWFDEAYEVVDVSEYTARMKVRKLHSKTLNTPSYAEPEVLSITSPYDIVMGGVDGTIMLNIPDTLTAAIPAGSYYYDIELIDTDGVIKFSRGLFDVYPEATF